MCGPAHFEVVGAAFALAVPSGFDRVDEDLQRFEDGGLSVAFEMFSVGRAGAEDSFLGRFESELLARVKSSNPGLLEGIRTKKDLTAELETELKSVLDAFTKTFA